MTPKHPLATKQACQKYKSALSTLLRQKLDDDDLDPEFRYAMSYAYLQAIKMHNAAFGFPLEDNQTKLLYDDVVKRLHDRWMEAENETAIPT